MGNNRGVPDHAMPKRKSPRYFSSLRGLANHFGMSINTLSGWQSNGIIRKKPKGWYSRDAEKILRQKIADMEETQERLEESEGSKNGDPSGTVEEKRLIEIKIKNLQYDELRGELLDRDEVLEDTTSMLRELRHRLMRFPKEQKLPLRMKEPDEIEERLEEGLSKILNDFADWVKKYRKGEK